MRTAAILFLLLFIPVGAFAQRVDGGQKYDLPVKADTISTLLAKNTGDSSQKEIPVNLTSSATSTLVSDSGEIPQGVIYVRKPDIIPYVRVEYKRAPA